MKDEVLLDERKTFASKGQYLKSVGAASAFGAHESNVVEVVDFEHNQIDVFFEGMNEVISHSKLHTQKVEVFELTGLSTPAESGLYEIKLVSEGFTAEIVSKLDGDYDWSTVWKYIPELRLELSANLQRYRPVSVSIVRDGVDSSSTKYVFDGFDHNQVNGDEFAVPEPDEEYLRKKEELERLLRQ